MKNPATQRMTEKSDKARKLGGRWGGGGGGCNDRGGTGYLNRVWEVTCRPKKKKIGECTSNKNGSCRDLNKTRSHKGRRTQPRSGRSGGAFTALAYDATKDPPRSEILEKKKNARSFSKEPPELGRMWKKKKIPPSPRREAGSSTAMAHWGKSAGGPGLGGKSGNWRRCRED